MDVSIIIVSYNTKDLLRNCLASLAGDKSSLQREVIVVDNASSDGTIEMVRQEFPWVRLEENDTNRGFASANNQGIKVSSGKYVLLLNPDTEVSKGSLDPMAEFMQRNPDTAATGTKLLNSDGTLQMSCRRFPGFLSLLGEGVFLDTTLIRFNYNEVREVDQPMGACLMVRRKVIDQVGMLDENYFMFFEEVDWCYRIKKAGWKIWFVPSAGVVHHRARAIRKFQFRMFSAWHRSRMKFFSKYCSHIPLISFWVTLFSLLPYIIVLLVVVFFSKLMGWLI